MWANLVVVRLNGKIIPNTNPPIKYKLNHNSTKLGPGERDFSVWVGDLSPGNLQSTPVWFCHKYCQYTNAVHLSFSLYRRGRLRIVQILLCPIPICPDMQSCNGCQRLPQGIWFRPLPRREGATVGSCQHAGGVGPGSQAHQGQQRHSQGSEGGRGRGL